MGSLPKNAYTEIGFRYKLKKETMHPLNEHAKCSLRYVGIYSGLSSLMKISLHCMRLLKCDEVLRAGQRASKLSDFRHDYGFMAARERKGSRREVLKKRNL